METGIHIGTKIDKESLEPLVDAILRIMEAKADQQTIRHALTTLEYRLETKTSNVSLHDVVLNGDTYPTYYGYTPEEKEDTNDL